MTNAVFSKEQNVTDWLRILNSQGSRLDLPELLFYRRFRNLKPVRQRRRPARGKAGAALSKFKGRGMEFDEVRHYQSGDDIRAIDWRVTARTGKAHTKLYREEKERPVFIMVDLSSSMHFGSAFVLKSVQAAHAAAAVAWQSAFRGDRVGGLIFNNDSHSEIKPLSRDKGVLRFLHSLVEIYNQDSRDTAPNSEQSTGFNDNLRRLQQLVKTGAEVYLLSDFHDLDERSVETMRVLTKHNHVQAWLIEDPLERELPATSPTQVSASDGEFTRNFWLGVKSINKDYQQRTAQWYQKRLSLLQQARVDCYRLGADKPLPLQWDEVGR